MEWITLSTFESSATNATCMQLLESLLSSPAVPDSIIERYAELLFQAILGSNGQTDSAAFRLLSVLYQRYGLVFSETSEKLLRAVVDDGDRLKFESILRSVALVGQSGSCRYITVDHSLFSQYHYQLVAIMNNGSCLVVPPMSVVVSSLCEDF